MCRTLLLLAAISAVSALVPATFPVNVIKARTRTPLCLRAVVANPKTGPCSEPALSPLSSEIHLISVDRPDWKTASDAHRRLWSWKLDVMGLAMTEKQYRAHRFSEDVVELCPEVVREALVISNCQRVLVVVAADLSADPSTLTHDIASMFEQRVSVWEKETNPTIIQPFRAGGAKQEEPRSIKDVFSSLSGTQAVARYLFRVAAGIPPESNLTAFSPFSSRDTHVLNQLKHAFAAASSRDAEADTSAAPPCKGLLGAVLRGSLEAGKLARDENAIPELRSLRPALKASREETARVAQVALERAVEPGVARAVSQVAALESGRRVALFRARAKAVAHAAALHARGGLGEEERRRVRLAVRRVLHAPTLALRQHRPVHEPRVMRRVAAAATHALTLRRRPDAPLRRVKHQQSKRRMQVEDAGAGTKPCRVQSVRVLGGDAPGWP